MQATADLNGMAIGNWLNGRRPTAVVDDNILVFPLSPPRLSRGLSQEGFVLRGAENGGTFSGLQTSKPWKGPQNNEVEFVDTCAPKAHL